MNLTEHWNNQLHIVAEWLISAGQHGYASQLGQVARHLELIDRQLHAERATVRVLAERLAQYPPPPKVYPGPLMMPMDPIKGDM